MERETGFEPATNSLEGCDSTPELLPLGVLRAVNQSKRLGRRDASWGPCALPGVRSLPSGGW
jgi:hypothetical protein